MGGRGSKSHMGGGGGGIKTVAQQPEDKDKAMLAWKEAFDSGTDYESSGDVNHTSRSVSASLQAKWDAFSAPYQTGMTAVDNASMMREFDWHTGQLYGYFRTTNAMKINQLLYQNPGKTIQEIFGNPPGLRNGDKDIRTIQTLDKAVSTHQTQSDAFYMRFCDADSIRRAFGFSDDQMSEISNARFKSPAEMTQLNDALKGSKSFSRGYTSTSANRSMNAFKDPHAKQSKRYYYERRLYAPSGTNAYAVRNNAQESEVLFGRNMRTRFLGVTVENGHTVIHEAFDGYQ